MRKIIAIIWKDARVRFTGFSEILFFIILPVVFTFLLAGGAPGNAQDPRVGLLVVDEAQTSLSAEIIAELDKSTAVRPEIATRQVADDQFSQRRASIVLSIPAGLDLAALQTGAAAVDLRQQPNDLEATVASRAVETALRQVSSAVNAANQAVTQQEKRQPFASAAEKSAYFDKSLAVARQLQARTPERVTVSQADTPEQHVDYDPRANASAGQMITWVFIPLFAISELFAYERSQGTLRRLLTTPTRKATYLLGTISGQVLFALIQMLLLVGFGVFVMKVGWGREPVALGVILLASALAAASLGTAMGTFVKTGRQANGLSTLAGMVMALMGGCWYPLELFPPAIQTAVRILPTTWAMQGLLDLLLRGKGLLDILPVAGVLLGFAAVFFTIGIWRFRYE
jgi:ABC-2 type transport system permease protein